MTLIELHMRVLGEATPRKGEGRKNRSDELDHDLHSFAAQRQSSGAPASPRRRRLERLVRSELFSGAECAGKMLLHVLSRRLPYPAN